MARRALRLRASRHRSEAIGGPWPARADVIAARAKLVLELADRLRQRGLAFTCDEDRCAERDSVRAAGHDGFLICAHRDGLERRERGVGRVAVALLDRAGERRAALLVQKERAARRARGDLRVELANVGIVAGGVRVA